MRIRLHYTPALVTVNDIAKPFATLEWDDYSWCLERAMKRRTTQRKAIEQIFQTEDRPLAIEEVLRYGRSLVESLNQATVYRNLKLLVASGRLHQINHPVLGTLYEQAGKEHHHHFHCYSCNRVFELPGCALNEEQAAPEGFIIEEHEIYLSGTCPNCASSLPAHRP